MLVRADADGQIGMGHIMRTLALAQAWRRRGGRAIFACASLVEAVEEKIVAGGFEVRQIEGCPGDGADAEGTMALAAKAGAQVLVCDGYRFDGGYLEKVGKGVDRLLWVTDFPSSESLPADFLLNQNVWASLEDYAERPAGRRFLLGAGFAMLREEFRSFPRGSRAPEEGEAAEGKRVLVSLGGADPDDVTAKILRALKPLAAADGCRLRAVVGTANPHLEALLSEFGEDEGVELLINPASMVEVLAEADLVVSGGGSTCWELCYLGKPMILLSLAENQERIVKGLAAAGAARDAGGLEPGRLRSEVEDLLQDSEARAGMSRAGMRLVDGRGADRVAAALDGRLHLTLATAGEGWVRETVGPFVEQLKRRGHEVSVVYDNADVAEGDIAMFLSFWSIVPAGVLERNAHNLVVHASALPQGKGWSPLTWQILEGENRIPLTLFEAEPSVDSGDIYDSAVMEFSGHELLGELREKLMEKTFELCLRFIDAYPEVITRRKPQEGESSFYKRRSPEDSRLDPDKSIAAQFNLFRTVDNECYPAHFDHLGHRFLLRIEKCSEGGSP